MAVGPGKYDDLVTLVGELAAAQAAIVIVLNGNRGSGFGVQATGRLTPAELARLLRSVADQIEDDGGH